MILCIFACSCRTLPPPTLWPNPLPRVDKLIDGLGRAKMISTPDMSPEYHQIPVHKDSIHNMAFITPQENGNNMNAIQFKEWTLCFPVNDEFTPPAYLAAYIDRHCHS